MDIGRHLKGLEDFSRRIADRHGGLASSDSPLVARDEGEATWLPEVEAAVEFLRRAGARPSVVEVRDGRDGPLLGYRIQSYDPRTLTAYLEGLPNARAVAEWVERGVEVGALSVRGERIFLVVETGHGGGVTPRNVSADRGIEATSVVVTAAQRLMEGEARTTLNQLEQARAAGGGEIFHFRPDAEGGDRELVSASTPEDGVLGRIKQLVQKPTPLLRAEDLGSDPRLVAVGPPVQLAGGTYYPVEVVDRRGQKKLGERAARRPAGARTWVKAAAVEPVKVPALEESEPALEESSPDKKRAAQVQAAYKLLHGLTLAPGEGAPLEAGVAARMESFFGSSFGDVRVHTGRVATQVVEALGVEALSMGTHVVIPERLMARQDGAGERTLVHELAHVKQYRAYSPLPRNAKEQQADAAVQDFLSGRARNLAQRSTMPTRAAAPPPSARGAMPAGVYASPQRKNAAEDPGPAPEHPRGIGLRTEDKLRRITQAIGDSQRRAQEDLKDREG